ncbi:hypothetical protein FQR65_LT07845 [Abscondita terminalis]|nr:hypothetical protein FQR65_LT07845 [Abscondita terminalis]
MKFFILLSCILSFSYAVKLPTNLQTSWSSVFERYYTKCLCEVSGVNTTLASNYIKNFQCTSNHPFKCFLNCLFLKVGLIDEAGGIKADEWTRRFPGITTQVVGKCNNSLCGENDTCEIAYDFYECVLYLNFDFSV